MLVVKLEMHNASGGEPKEIGRVLIADDGTGNLRLGNYEVKVLHRGTWGESISLQWSSARPARKGRVPLFPRLELDPWRLVLRALKSAFPEEELPDVTEVSSDRNKKVGR